MPASFVWQPGPNGGTPTNAANLNRLALTADIGVAGTPTGDALKAAYVALGQLAASPDLMAVGTITRSVNGAATSFGVVWPDGATGTFTGTESTGTPGAIDSYTVTHVLGGVTVTYTQHGQRDDTQQHRQRRLVPGLG